MQSGKLFLNKLFTVFLRLTQRMALPAFIHPASLPATLGFTRTFCCSAGTPQGKASRSLKSCSHQLGSLVIRCMHTLNNCVPWAGVLFFKRPSALVFAYFYILNFNFKFSYTEYSLNSFLYEKMTTFFKKNMPKQPHQQVHHCLEISVKSHEWVSHHWTPEDSVCSISQQFFSTWCHFSSETTSCFPFLWLTSHTKATGLKVEELVSAQQTHVTTAELHRYPMGI